jgi:hypothetical protein
LTRWIPVPLLTLGVYDATSYLRKVKITDCITNQVPTFTINVADPSGKWDAVDYADPVLLTIDNVAILRGRVDDWEYSVEKAPEGGEVISYTGRGNAGALQDILTSMHVVSRSAYDIVDDLLAEYANRKQSKDPAIAVGSNTAPDNVYLTFLWKGRDLWSCFQDVSTALGGIPTTGQFYDFYANPSGDFYFNPIGVNSSGVTIARNSETIAPKRHVSSIPIKNDIWLFANTKMGCVPLEMQLGYNGNGVTDPWTEGNASDYHLSGSLSGAFSISDETDPTYVMVGSKSIKISGVIFSLIGTDSVCWYLQFPLSGKWAAQTPGGHFNAYNECMMTDGTSGMRELMGEFNACDFYLTSDCEFDLYIQVKDSSNLYAVSPSIHYKPSFWGNLTGLGTLPVALPFGPSGNYTIVSNETPPPLFDWSDVVQIGWLARFPIAVGTVHIWFDGLRFVKPLVTNVSDPGATTRRSQRISKEAIISYADAVSYAHGILENQKLPQIYWSLENIGRIDLPTGKTFKYGTTDLLLREVVYDFSKDEGWKLTGTAWEQT